MASCSFPLTHLIRHLWMKTFMYVTLCGEQESTEVWCYFYPVPRTALPVTQVTHIPSSCHTACQSGGKVQRRSVGTLGMGPGALHRIPPASPAGGIQPCQPLFNTSDILGRTMSLFLCVQAKSLRFQGQIWLCFLFESAASFCTSNLPWKNAEIPVLKVF